MERPSKNEGQCLLGADAAVGAAVAAVAAAAAAGVSFCLFFSLRICLNSKRRGLILEQP